MGEPAAAGHLHVCGGSLWWGRCCCCFAGPALLHPASLAPHWVQVAPNPELRGFTVTGANMLPQARVQTASCESILAAECCMLAL